MARKLGEILVAGKLVSPADLKKALDAQLIFGGRLGTNLLDLGLLDEESLIEALKEQKRVDVATSKMLEAAGGDALRLVPAALADRHKAVPFHLEERKLKVAMLDPLDLIALDELAFVTGCVIVPYLSPEVRLLYWLERYYSIPRPRRFIRLSDDEDEEAAGAEEVGATGALPPSTAADRWKPAPGDLGASSEREAPPLDLEDVLGLVRGAAVTPRALGAASGSSQDIDAVVAELKRRTEDGRRRAETARGPATLSEVAAQLASAEGRDDVGEALVWLARAGFSRVAAWIIQKDRALGWMGSVEGLAPENARRMARAASASLAEPSVLSELVASRQYFMGELPSRHEDLRIGDIFGSPRPRNVLLLPVELGEQVVIVLHCDDADRAFGQFDLRGLRSACQKAGQAMEVLLLRSRIRQL
jgi:hypothetical protein